jgi:hypothetical protein
MNWLYCKNGVVLGWHEPHFNYLPSIYGDGVTIVPYRGSMSQLQHIGETWPEGAGPDTRPIAAPTITEPDDLIEAAKAKKQLICHHATSLEMFEDALATLGKVLEGIKAGHVTSLQNIESAGWPSL